MDANLFIRAVMFATSVVSTPGSRNVPYAWVESEEGDLWVLGTNGHRLAGVLIPERAPDIAIAIDRKDVVGMTGQIVVTPQGVIGENNKFAFPKQDHNFPLCWRKVFERLPDEYLPMSEPAVIQGAYHMEAVAALLQFGEKVVVETRGANVLWIYLAATPAPFLNALVTIAPCLEVPVCD